MNEYEKSFFENAWFSYIPENEIDELIDSAEQRTERKALVIKEKEQEELQKRIDKEEKKKKATEEKQKKERYLTTYG